MIAVVDQTRGAELGRDEPHQVAVGIDRQRGDPAIWALDPLDIIGAVVG